MRISSHIFIFILVDVSLQSFAQGYGRQPEFQHYTCEKHKTGCYLSFKDFIDDHPFIGLAFTMEKRRPNEKKESRSGGYQLRFYGEDPESDDNTSRQLIRKDRIWGVYYDDTLYINRKLYIGKEGFDKVFCLGNQGYFHGVNPKSDAGYDKDALNSTLLLWAVGGIVASAVHEGKENQFGKYPLRMIYLLDYETGMISPLNSFKLEKILEDDPNLSDLYQKEKYKFSMTIMHLYIDAYTERHKNEIINK